ncbi:MAG: hypothetical protein OXL96_13945 [Candidatus Poribacteria bacterium]|nr:hypothetical protein [Candidatus Poribacteria bacterium]
MKKKRQRKKKISGSGRNTLERKLEAIPAGYESHAFEGCEISEFVQGGIPDPESQLWFTLYNKQKGDVTIRFKGPGTIGDIIEQLVCYRKKIWPDAPELDFDKDFSE